MLLKQHCPEPLCINLVLLEQHWLEPVFLEQHKLGKVQLEQHWLAPVLPVQHQLGKVLLKLVLLE
jgi:hypothetical protein